MFHFNSTGLAITRLGPTALGAVETLQSTQGLYVESGAVQVMIFHDRIGKLGGISTKSRGQYLLSPAVSGRITIDRLKELGFPYKTRKGGSHYWYRPGHDDFHNFLAALEEMTGLSFSTQLTLGSSLSRWSGPA